MDFPVISRKMSPLNVSDTSSLLDISAHNAAHGGKELSMAMAFIPPPVMGHVADVLVSLEKSIGISVPLFSMVVCEPEIKDASVVFY